MSQIGTHGGWGSPLGSRLEAWWRGAPPPKKYRAEAREGIAMLSCNAVSWVLHNNPGFADVCFFKNYY